MFKSVVGRLLILTRASKNKETAYEAPKKLTNYLKNHYKSVMETLQNQNLVFFVGLGFEIVEESARLETWIVVPYEDGKLQHELVDFNLEEIKTRFKDWMKTP